MNVEKGALGFVAPATVHQGDELNIVNETDPKKVGPHTFSLVTKGSLPKTPKARKNCFTPKHICLSIAQWHGFNPKTEKITINPAKAGPPGWSTMGSTSKKGDSWFTGEKKGHLVQPAGDRRAGHAIYFICAIHPWMQGKIKVLPPPAAASGTSERVHIHAPPGAPSFPRRPGRRRARLPAACQGRRPRRAAPVRGGDRRARSRRCRSGRRCRSRAS